MNYFKEAERILSNRKTIDRSLQNLKRRRDRLVDSGAPQGVTAIDPAKPYVSGGMLEDTMTECLDLMQVNKEIKITEEKIKEIDAVISQLKPENKKILTLWYKDLRTKEQMLDDLHFSSFSTLYDNRNRAIGEFAILYFGAPALDAI